MRNCLVCVEYGFKRHFQIKLNSASFTIVLVRRCLSKAIIFLCSVFVVEASQHLSLDVTSRKRLFSNRAGLSADKLGAFLLELSVGVETQAHFLFSFLVNQAHFLLTYLLVSGSSNRKHWLVITSI